jgi:FAD/FMN-containing dehydrogenase
VSSHTTPDWLRGQDHPDWESTRLGWNLAADQRPTAIAEPETVDDVIAAVNYAREAGLRVAPQATGHGSYVLAAGDGTLVLKLGKMRGVEIDADAGIARVEGGAQWGDVTAASTQHGLVALAGSSADVGVAGYTTGGGLSWLARRHGLACNSVRAVEVVNAAGELVRADAETNPDLFWAVRGGGGAFGVITAFELELFPVEMVYGGAMLWPIERDTEVLQAWRTWVDTVPDEVTSLGRLLHLPPIPEIPEPFRGRDFVAVEAVCLLDAEEGAAMLEPLRALGPEIDLFGMMPGIALEKLHMDPEGPVPGIGEGLVLTDVTDETIEAAVRTAGHNSGSALVSFEFRHLGGAVARPAEGAGCLASLDEGFIAYGVGMTPVPPLVEAVKGSVSATFGALEPWRGARQLPSWRESVTAPAELFGTSYERLQTVKADVDPDNLFQSSHSL